ncbi:MAPEG family protein [Marinimicrobium sp. C6131]|uniref:MAPEG family protein n=1 Tax=Marinimicrobium sp. C6131 TaxID=3022676 RepID=UPI00223CD8B9|nr:MAPEG family protein [Marinimicrobium sp. C6131]UZJ44513.1 MAPEG family protein [Marinimicrobium sp. C6131]
MREDYQLAYIGLAVVLITLLVQMLVASSTKARQPGAIPGKIDESLSHHSFVFRAHRTFMNSLENLPLFFGTVFLALFAGMNATWLGVAVWVFALARIAHMVLYYWLATERNPSPRSYFYLIALLANVVLLVGLVLQLANMV